MLNSHPKRYRDFSPVSMGHGERQSSRKPYDHQASDPFESQDCHFLLRMNDTQNMISTLHQEAKVNYELHKHWVYKNIGGL